MARRTRSAGAGRERGEPRFVPARPFVELLRPAAGRELVLELEDARGTRLRLTLRDGGRWRLAGLEEPQPGRSA